MSSGSVGVVIPTRDRPDLLQNAIRSVLDQTRPPDEFIVVDDASSSPIALPADLVDRGIRVLRCAQQVGPSAARNMGMQVLETDLVAFIDDDDLWARNKLEEQSKLVRSTDALVSCDYEVVPQRGRTEDFRVPRDLASLRRSLILEPTLPPSTVLAGRELLLSVGGFDPDLRMMEDWDLWLRVIDAVDFQVVARVMVHKRSHQGSAQQIRDSRRVMRGRLQPYVAEMNPRDRARFEAHHDVMDALLAIETGHRGTAVRGLVSSLRRSPSKIALQGIVRATVGETIWQRVQRVKRGSPLRD